MAYCCLLLDLFKFSIVTEIELLFIIILLEPPKNRMKSSCGNNTYFIVSDCYSRFPIVPRLSKSIMCTNTRIQSRMFLVILFLDRLPMRVLCKCKMLESNWYSSSFWITNRESSIWKKNLSFLIVRSMLTKYLCALPAVTAHCIVFKRWSQRSSPSSASRFLR